MSSVAELRALTVRLAEVLKRREWEHLGEVDRAIRALLQRLDGRSLSAEEQAAKQTLRQVHEQARHAGAEECERLRQLLLTHLEYAEGRSAYSQVELMQGGR